MDQMLSDYIEVLKAEQNLFWSKRLVFEAAGWDRNFDVESFRRGCEEYERQFRETTSVARVGLKGQSIYNSEHGAQLKEWYRQMAGDHAV